MFVSSCGEDTTKSKLKIYDLEAIKNRESKDGAVTAAPMTSSRSPR
jgi:hypothetical protein